MNEEQIRVSKIDAARRQLDCAIELWFYGKDEVSIHTLAAAAYQIIHDINEKKGQPGRMLYDAVAIKPEHRARVTRAIKEPSNFFKHADNDPEGIVEFSTFSSLGFMLFAVIGLGFLGERKSDLAHALGVWISIHDPELIDEKNRKTFTDRAQIEQLEQFKRIPKKEFLQIFFHSIADARAQGLI